jgi:hypothetical protein
MTNNISEFIDTYSDDIIYLLEARKFLVTHPSRSSIDKHLIDASFSRIFAILMIGNIEQMLQEWKTRVPVVEPYFQKNTSMKDKVDNLCQAFKNIGLNVDREIFNDYLAIKYLRNIIVHADWNEEKCSDKIKVISDRGFPTDTRNLNEEHLRKMHSVNENIIFYIAASEYRERIDGHTPIKRNSKLVKLQNFFEEYDGLGLVKKEQIAHLFWRNLEKISEYINKDIEKTVLSENYIWSKGYTNADIESMSHDDRKRLYYLAARQAGRDGVQLLVQHCSLAKDALDSWHEYWRLTYEQQGISIEKIKSSIEILSKLHKRKIYSDHSLEELNNNMPENIAIKYIQSVLNNYSPLTEIQIIDAFKGGGAVYKITLNITAVFLFTIQLPVIDPENTEIYFQEAEKALQAMELRSLWCKFVNRKSNEGIGSFEFYREMMSKFSQ